MGMGYLGVITMSSMVLKMKLLLSAASAEYLILLQMTRFNHPAGIGSPWGFCDCHWRLLQAGRPISMYMCNNIM